MVDQVAVEWAVPCTDFISCIHKNERERLFSLGQRRQFCKDSMVFDAGSSNDDVFILLDGRIKIFELSQEGKEVILWFCFPGEIFGLAEVMCRQRSDLREVNAQACSYVEVLSIKQSDFARFLFENPSTSMRVIDLLCYRLRELGDVLLNLASDDVTSRVVKLITRLGTRYGKVRGEEVYLDIPLTHQEMADMIGTSRQTVTTVLGRLKRKGVLKVEHRSIYIKDYQWVENIARLQTSMPKADNMRFGFA